MNGGNASAQGTVATDRAALVALYNATDGPSWANNANWLSTEALSTWYGVTTDGNGRVTVLDLEDNQLSGEIPAALGNLSNLRNLRFEDNQLSGEIPAALGNLTNLRELDLCGNRLSGEIPAMLGNLSNLQIVNLYDNQVSGEIPAALGNLSNLRILELWSNRLSGEIPAMLGNLANLETLNLYDNRLSGEIPAALGNLTNLRNLELWVNRLSGEVPAALGNLTSLEDLLLLGNPLLSGPLPLTLSALPALKLLDIRSTDLCAPNDPAFQAWLATIDFTGAICAAPPQFSVMRTTREVPENSGPGIDVGAPVTATDVNGDMLTYTLGGPDADSFTIVSTTGQIRTKSGVTYNRETKSTYSVTVTADDGTGTATISVMISVTIVSEQPGSNNPPTFTEGTSTTRSIVENTASGQNIGAPVTATDADTGDTLTYTLGGTDASAFSINKSTGQLRTSAALDYDTKSSYTVTVTVSDGNGGTDSISVNISVTVAPESEPEPEEEPGGSGGGGGGGGGLIFPPQAPAALAVLPEDKAVRLQWSPPENDGGSPIQRYEYRPREGREEFAEWTPIPDSAVDEVNASGFTVSDLLNGTVYAFELRAVNAAGNGQESEAVEVTMLLDPSYRSNFRAEDLVGVELMLEAFLLEGSSRDRLLRFGEGFRFEEDELDGEGEVTATHMGSYGYRYTSRTTGELGLEFDEGESCRLRLTFSGEGAGSYSYRCGGSSRGQGSFGMSELENRGPEITGAGPFEVEENRTSVGRLEAVDWDEEDEVAGYGITGGADGGLFRVETETGELSFAEAPDYENPADVESEDPASEAGDNEYIVVVEVTSGEGERERTREQAIRVRVSDVEMEEAGGDEMGEETESLFVPVILSSAGRNNSFFTSELTLTNRGAAEVKLNYTYTADAGGGSGTASDVLAAGRQGISTNALTYLRGLGIPIPETGNRIGTLRVEAPPRSDVRAVVRTTTVVPDGRAGLAYLGIAEEEGFEEPVYLCGLRQNSRDRSNVAFQNMGGPGEGAITLRTTVYSGESSDTSPRELDDITLEPGGFHQYSGLLGRIANGYVKVERVEGEAPFYAYGVINDQVNSDGSFVFPVTATSLEGKRAQTLPVIVETRDFTSELTVTNFSEEERTLAFEFVSEQIQGDEKVVGFRMELKAGEQVIVPELVEALRREQMAGLGSRRGFYLGALFVTAEEGDLSGVVVGARTSSEGGGGQYGVFYNAVPEGEGFDREAWVEGLQQNAENRSNLALVNTGEVDDSPSVFHLEIYNGETGMLEETVVTKEVPARGWHQIDGILLRAGPGDPARVHPDREGIGGEPVSGLRGGQRRRRSRGNAVATGPICRPESRDELHGAAVSRRG